ncbi:regulatory protein UhpC [Klebsiella michiganensis]|nr:regulatory protein UhpC [Klebsiella michiganensis]
MFAFLKSPPAAPPITDKPALDARYRYWRRHILLTIWLGYALFYFTRKSFNAAVPEILASNVLTRSDIGLLATLFYITYGLSKFFSGIVSDRSNARYFMGIGLVATGVVNILFGFSTSLWAFALLWALNAFFQGWGSPVCARLLTTWYSRTERGGWWALWNTAHNVGGALIPMVVGAAALHYGWRTGMMIAGMLAILAGLFLCWRLRDRPQAVGLPAVGDWRHDELEIAQQQEGAGLTRKEILTKYVLLNPLYLAALRCATCWCTWCARRLTTGATCICRKRSASIWSRRIRRSPCSRWAALSARWWRAGARINCLTATAGR